MRLHNTALILAIAAFALAAGAQSFTTTTVQGTVYLAGGAPASGSLQISWPAFTTAAGQAIAAGHSNTTIGHDGFVSVNLAPNIGASPAGLYYTAIYHLADGSTSTEYRRRRPPKLQRMLRRPHPQPPAKFLKSERPHV